MEFFKIIRKAPFRRTGPGTLRQQYPYVVQRKGHQHLTIDGKWIDNDGATTHIPLEIYQFKGWKS
jgi:hypothetical protein